MPAKLVFMVVETDVNLVNEVANLLRASFEDAVVYTANEGGEALKKMLNVPPTVLITGLELGKKVSGAELFRSISQEKIFAQLPILVLSDLPDNAPNFANDMASGRMKFLSMPLELEALVETVKAILKSDSMKDNIFRVINLKAGDTLFKEGDQADRAFLVKSGKLQAVRMVNAQEKILGEVLPGEFVGEMAHITGEPRSADVKAIEDCVLIEIPCGTLDLLVFAKPTWTKALLKTLCRRLREANLKKR